MAIHAIKFREEIPKNTIQYTKKFQRDILGVFV